MARPSKGRKDNMDENQEDPEVNDEPIVNYENLDATDIDDSTIEENEDDKTEEPGNRKPPWHFKAFIVITVIYLGYRMYQGIEWLLHHIK